MSRTVGLEPSVNRLLEILNNHKYSSIYMVTTHLRKCKQFTSACPRDTSFATGQDVCGGHYDSHFATRGILLGAHLNTGMSTPFIHVIFREWDGRKLEELELIRGFEVCAITSLGEHEFFVNGHDSETEIQLIPWKFQQ